MLLKYIESWWMQRGGGIQLQFVIIYFPETIQKARERLDRLLDLSNAYL